MTVKTVEAVENCKGRAVACESLGTVKRAERVNRAGVNTAQNSWHSERNGHHYGIKRDNGYEQCGTACQTCYILYSEGEQL